MHKILSCKIPNQDPTYGRLRFRSITINKKFFLRQPFNITDQIIMPGQLYVRTKLFYQIECRDLTS